MERAPLVQICDGGGTLGVQPPGYALHLWEALGVCLLLRGQLKTAIDRHGWAHKVFFAHTEV
jgi:hypothetical protein